MRKRESGVYGKNGREAVAITVQWRKLGMADMLLLAIYRPNISHSENLIVINGKFVGLT